MNPTRVEVTIDELVLHGFAPGHRHAIAAALQSELMRLIGEQGVPAALLHGGELERIDAKSFSFTPAAPASFIGAQVAQAVYGGPTS